MSTHDDVEHRARHTAPGEQIEVREVGAEDREGAWFAIRMPISSTAEARDGVAFTRDRLDGWREQIERGTVPVFADHGKNDDVADSRYSAFGKFGYYANAELADRDGATDLVADTVVLDPANLPEETGDYRTHLAILKAQAEAGMPITASVGWKDDTGDRDVPGDSDLLEGSIVGIPSDTRANTTADADAVAMARAVDAASEGFDVGTFVRELTTGDRNTVEVGGEEIDLTPPEAVQNAATVALAKDDELEPDCGTGAGRDSAQQIAGDDVTAERIDDIAAYLTSHEEDVSAEGPPSDWSDEEWQDCGNLQYALWGGTGTGAGLEWAQEKANQVAEAKGDELPYPERAADEDTMTEDDTEPDDESGTDTDDEQTRGMEEMMAEMVDMQEEQTSMLREMYEKEMDGDEDDGEDDEEDGEDGGENAADADDEDERDEEPEDRTVTLDGEELTVDEARDHIADLREDAEDVDPEEPSTQDRAEGDDEDSTDDDTSDTTSGFGLAAREER